MTSHEEKEKSFAGLRDEISRTRGREYWRSLEELSRSESFEEFFVQEFPQQAQPLGEGVDRRDFVKLMGASVAFAGLTACNRPAEKIIPYVRTPEGVVPGKPLFFATAMPLCGVATGVLVESHTGRPTKIEGNPDHPSSLGATDPFMQAAILSLYDPDRSQTVRHLGEISTWGEFIGAMQPVLTDARTRSGAGVRILTQTVNSPTVGAQIQQFLASYPAARWHQWEPAGRDNAREGGRLAFGSYVNTVYHFDKANTVVSLDANFLACGPGNLRYARDFMSRRRVRKGTTSMNRLYVVEAAPSSTGSVADHRLPLRPGAVEGLARAVAAGLGIGAAPAAAEHAAWVAAVVRDLQANRGASIVVAGDQQPPVVHQLAHAINSALGNIGTTVTITDPIEVAPVNHLDSLRQLVADIHGGTVRTLIMLGGNPVFDAPSDLEFREALARVPARVHLSTYYDETAELSHWHIPETHFLESWSDARAHDGTVSIIQPLIAPLYNGRSAHEVLAVLNGLDLAGYDIVRRNWQGQADAATFDASWRGWLNDGVIAGSALPPRAGSAGESVAPAAGGPQAGGIELQFRPDPTIFDGRFANNGWLQELPKPITKITWDNALLVSPRTAARLNIAPGEDAINERTTILVRVDYHGRQLELPVWIVPGHADDAATIHYGYGRTRSGHVGDHTGANVYPLRFSDALDIGRGASVSRTSNSYKIACTQEHQNLSEGGDRHIIRHATLAGFLADAGFAKHDQPESADEDVSLVPQWNYKTDSHGNPLNAWGMVIDPGTCIGCNGCVIACQSENNIAVVGKDQVWREREMQWLRIDRYYSGAPENPEIYNQPIPCMQCENAPCEPVCPVEATAHSAEGLNDMTYNRCVGTRYCSNNCPYKVRRFNFYQYSDYYTPSLKPMRNPEVTVRTRGVMEKCTYCVQRINAAKITAEREDRPVRDGEIVTACQQACPTDAIVFGNINDPASRVARLKSEPHNYALLAELNTRPRTTYLGVIRNPNPELKAE
jgi:MoCo/4Fe-4S cofactor protein with predicted Tat translocation signal